MDVPSPCLFLYGMSCGLRRSRPDEASSAGTREPLLPRPSRRSRVPLCLLGSASTHKQKHRAAFVDLQHLAVGAQSDFANWRCASGMENRQVVEPVGAARIYGKEPKRLRMVIVVNRAAARGPQILSSVS